MSYKKVMFLANKFAEKTVLYNPSQEKIVQKEKLSQFFYDLERKVKALLNEMGGDLYTCKHKGIDRALFQEFTNLYHKYLEVVKSFDEHHPYDSMSRLVNFVFSKQNRVIIKTLDDKLQNFLKENEVDFGPSAAFSQARIESLKNLHKIALITHNWIQSNPVTTEAKLPGKEDEFVSVPSSEMTKVEKK